MHHYIDITATLIGYIVIGVGTVHAVLYVVWNIFEKVARLTGWYIDIAQWAADRHRQKRKPAK